MRLRQWLLLAARILAILMLVMVFAKPVFRSANTAVIVGNSSVAIVIDNSYSMKGGNDKGIYWVQAQEIAKEIAEAYTKNDEFLIMNSDDPKLQYNFGEQQGAIKEIRKQTIVQNTKGVADLLPMANDIFANAANTNKVLYVISDFQQSTVLPDSLLKLNLPADVQFNLVPLTTRQLKNAYIASHAVTTQIIEKEKPVTLSMELVNDSPELLKNIGLRVITNGEDRPVATKDLAAGEKLEVNINLLPKTPGWQSGYIQIDDSPIDFDNKRYFSYYVPYREKMLIVEEKNNPQLHMMFGGDVLDQFDVKFVSTREFAGENLNDYKSLMLVGLNEISTSLQEKLTSHLEDGRSILFFPGTEMDINSVNGFFQALKLGSFGKKIEAETGQMAGSVDLDHPVFEGVFSKKANRNGRKFDSPTVYKSYEFRPENSVIQNTILAIDERHPILMEAKPLNGLFYTFAFNPSKAWTDMTIKTSGLALMVQLARMMNQTQRVEAVMDLGETTYLRIKTSGKDIVKIVGQEGQEATPEQYIQSGYIVLKFDKLKLPEGNYDLVQEGTLLEKISFNVPDAESQLAAWSGQEIRDLLEKSGNEQIQVNEAVRGSFSEVIQANGEGLPLWKYFLMAALFFFLAEFLILRVGNKKATN